MRVILLVAFIASATIGNAQSGIGEYDFIEVSDRFEFVTGDNTYQLSDMMVYYFEKKGIKAYRQQDSPNVAKCDALYADIEKGTSILSSKLAIVIKDCNDTVVFRSKEGKSKVKAYAKAYPDALRTAFSTFAKSDIKILDVSKAVVSDTKEVKDTSMDNVVVTVTDTQKEAVLIKVEETATSAAIVQIPETAFSNYELNGQSYLLKKVATGFTLFLTQEGNDNFIKVGDIAITTGASFTMVDIYGENKMGRFNTKQDLVIQLANGDELVYVKQL